MNSCVGLLGVSFLSQSSLKFCLQCFDFIVLFLEETFLFTKLVIQPLVFYLVSLNENAKK